MQAYSQNVVLFPIIKRHNLHEILLIFLSADKNVEIITKYSCFSYSYIKSKNLHEIFYFFIYLYENVKYFIKYCCFSYSYIKTLMKSC